MPAQRNAIYIFFFIFTPVLPHASQVVVVTEEFEGKPLVARHRMVNTLFAEEMTGATPKMHGKAICIVDVCIASALLLFANDGDAAPFWQHPHLYAQLVAPVAELL